MGGIKIPYNVEGNDILRKMRYSMRDQQLMTVTDVIEAMGISRSTWQKLVAQKQTPPIVKIGAVQRIRRDAFEAWLTS